MSVVKGGLVVILIVMLALGVFNGLFVAISAYFGPFYEGDADQSRNFAIWLLGNVGVLVVSTVAGVIWCCRHRRGSEVE